MKIAQVTPYFFPVEGGVERHVMSLSRELVRKGHEVDVYTCRNDRNGGVLKENSEVDGISVRRFKSILSLGEFGRVWPGMLSEIAASDYDAVHAHVYRHPHSDLSLIASKLSGSRSVLTTHSPFHPSSVRKTLARVLVPIYDRTIGPVSLRGYDEIISLTQVEANRLVSLGADRARLTIIPHGIDSNHFEKVDASDFLSRHGLVDHQVVLYLGRINPTKGLGYLVEAFATASKTHPRSTLVLAGPCTDRLESDYASSLSKKGAELGISDRMVVTGALSEEDKLAALGSCTVFVLASVYEPYGIVLLEAAAHGRAIIATATDGPSSILRDGYSGALVPPSDPEALSAKISMLLDDDGLRESMGERAKQLATAFTWERVASSVERTYLRTGIPN